MAADDRAPYSDSATYRRDFETPADIEAETTGEAEVHEGKIDSILASILGVNESTLVRSKTWSFTPDPLTYTVTNGERSFSMSGMRFTIVEVDNPPLRTYCTLSIPTWTSHGWTTTGPDGRDFQWNLHVQDANRGDLDVFLNRKSIYCANNPPFNGTYELDRIYDLVRRARIRSTNNSRWRRC